MDSDSYGDNNESSELFALPPCNISNYSTNNTDCDDTNPNIFPGSAEICDGLDNDCNGSIDEGFDIDNDNVVDCIDNCPTISNATQIDSDGDGHGDACDCNPSDPNDNDLQIHTNPIVSSTYNANENITSTGNIHDTSTVAFLAGESITLETNFIAEEGSDFIAKIESCNTPPAPLSQNPNDEPIFFKSEKETTSKNTINMEVSPNPFQSRANIVINLEENTTLDLSIYDMMGNQLEKIIDRQYKIAGTHHFNVNGERWKPGIYFVVLRSENKTFTEKIILVK